jgi:UDP-N-acetylmuramate--alanine ligase
MHRTKINTNNELIHNISQYHHFHFVGIKGVAMTSLALYLKESGKIVSGSDVKDEFPTDELLKEAHIQPDIGFLKNHITDSIDCVIYTGAHNGRDNIEVQEALHRKIPVFPHGIALGLVMFPYRQISVAGCHGKTTTSAMIASILSKANVDPSYAIGCGRIPSIGFPGHKGNGEWFVAEADEYMTDPGHDTTPRYYFQNPELFVITNIDFDHPDVYKDINDVKQHFINFIQSQKKLKYLIINADDEQSSPLTKTTTKVLQFGLANNANLKPMNIQYREHSTSFELSYNGISVGTCELHVPGMHNVLNATAAALACKTVGLSFDVILQGLKLFSGSKRRFNLIDERDNILFYDDYAHHPKEIKATLSAVKAWFPKRRLLVVFQPHTYSRTKSLLLEFAEAFYDADIVCITDIYASARETKLDESLGSTIVSEIHKHHDHVYFTKKPEDVTTTLHSIITKGDLVVFMGAGDIYNWEQSIINQLEIGHI